MRSPLSPILLCLLALAGSLPLHAEGEPPVDAAPPADAAPPTATPDTEQQMSAVLRARFTGGEALNLQAGEREVLALFTPQSRSDAEGAVLLLHERHDNADHPGPIGTLRRTLPEAGWHTLSLQLPPVTQVDDALARLDAIRPRISAALAELQRRKIRNIVIVGHGEGALAAADYLGNNLAPGVRGLITIGLDGSEQGEPRLDGAAALGRVAVPTLDVYGEFDLPGVVQSARRRYDLARRANEQRKAARPAYEDIARDYTEKKGTGMGFRQVQISGANHHFNAVEDALAKRLRGWLTRHAAGKEI